MREIAVMFLMLAWLACGNAERAGAEAVRKEAESEQKAIQRAEPTAPKVHPPVPGKAKLSCANVVDATKFTGALEETAAITVVDSTSEPLAAASCSLIRGGKRLSEREQKAQIKRHRRLGVLAGDEICNISAFCWTIEDADHFAGKCREKKDQRLDDGLGFQACLRVVATGEWDVNLYAFFDPDTKCVLQVRAGPSMVDNHVVAKCAKAARDLIGPEQIRVR